MEATELLQELSTFNYITFFDKKHKYKFRGITKQPISGTAVTKKFIKPFDSDYLSMKTAQKRKTTQEKVLAEWKANGEAASLKGTLFHEYAENYVNNKVFPNVTPKGLKNQFKNFYREYVAERRLIPVASEFPIGDKKLMVAGMIDQLFFNPKKQTLHIFDWKTNKKMDRTSSYSEHFLAPISHLEVCEFVQYSLQLSLYKYLITRNTSLSFGDNYIVWFNEVNDDYQLIKCIDLEKEVKKMLGVATR